MTTGVGLTVGDSVSTAVVTASGTDVRTIEHPSVLFTAPDGTVQLGDPGTESTGAVRDFLARVGEPAGIEYAGSLTRAEDLVATAMFCLFREASDGLTGTVKVTATHPSGWAPEIVTKLRESLDYMGLGEATLIAESVALTASAESPAHGAALLAAGLALTDEDTSADTESIPVVEAPLHTAYSAVTAVPAVAAASDAFPPAATEASAPASAPTPPVTRTNRRPLIIAGVAAARWYWRWDARVRADRPRQHRGPVDTGRSDRAGDDVERPAHHGRIRRLPDCEHAGGCADDGGADSGPGRSPAGAGRDDHPVRASAPAPAHVDSGDHSPVDHHGSADDHDDDRGDHHHHDDDPSRDDHEHGDGDGVRGGDHQDDDDTAAAAAAVRADNPR